MTERISSPKACARDVRLTADRREDELVGGEHELRRKTLAHRRMCLGDETAASLQFAPEDLVRIERLDRAPRVRPGDQDDATARFGLGAENARGPERPAGVVAALSLAVVAPATCPDQ